MIPVGLLCVDRVKPAVTMTSPANGATVAGTITVSATATDNDKIATVQLQHDGINLGAPMTAPPFQANVDTSGYSNAAHTFSAIATDRLGNSQSASVTATVNNFPPAVPNTAGPTGPDDGSGTRTGPWGAPIVYGSWVAQGRTLQYRVFASYTNDQGKALNAYVAFNDFAGTTVNGPTQTGPGGDATWTGPWTNVPFDSSHANVQAQMSTYREGGGDSTTSTGAAHIEYQWI